MSTRQDFLAAMVQLVSGDLPLAEADRILALAMAVKTYSRHRPRVIVEDEAGTAAFDYALSMLASWTEGFSGIRTVEYPVDDTDETPDMLRDDEWIIYEKPAGKVLRFLEDSPTALESMRITYTALHTCTDVASSVQAADEEAVQILAAAYYCEMLATYFAQNQDSTINADSVEHTSKARDYAARAKTYRRLYADYMGVSGGVVPASVTSDQDLLASWQGDKLTHKGKYR